MGNFSPRTFATTKNDMSDRIPVQPFEFEATVIVKKTIHTDTPDIDHQDQLDLLAKALEAAGYTTDIRESTIQKP